MSNTSLEHKEYLASSSNYGIGRAGKLIEKVTIHHMAGILTARQCGNIFQNPERKASSNYGIGKNGEIGLYVNECDTSYADANLESNRTSVTIECSNEEIGGIWKVSDKVLKVLIELIVDIFKRNKIAKAIKGETITWHRMYTNTTCPGDYLLSKMDYICEEVNKKLGNTVNIGNSFYVNVTSEIGLNLREEPNTTSKILKTYEKGETLTIFEVRENWGRTNYGWVCLDYTTYGKEETEIKNFDVGRYKVSAEVLTVRKGPATNYDWVRFSELTENAQKQVVSLSGYKPNGLCKGVVCDVFETKREWGKIPSGWINLRYCEKV